MVCLESRNNNEVALLPEWHKFTDARQIHTCDRGHSWREQDGFWDGEGKWWFPITTCPLCRLGEDTEE